MLIKMVWSVNPFKIWNCSDHNFTCQPLQKILWFFVVVVRVPLAQYPISFTSPKPPAYASIFPWCLHWCRSPTMTKLHPRISKSMMWWSWRRHGWGLVVQCIHVIWRKCHKEMLILIIAPTFPTWKTQLVSSV